MARKGVQILISYLARMYMKYLWKGNYVEEDGVSINPQDRGYQFGDGIYEVTHVYNGVLFGLEDHVERLLKSAEFIEMNLRHSKEEIYTFFQTLVRENKIDNGYVYLQVTRGDGTLRNHGFLNYEDQRPIFYGFGVQTTRSEDKQISGTDGITVEDRRSLMCNVKSLNLLPNCLAKHAAQKKNVSKAILVRDGIVTEEKSGNVFMIKDGNVYTHPDGGKILPGITKKYIITLLKDMNIPIYEKEFSEKEMMQADELIVTDTNSEVLPVIKVNNQIIGDGKRGKITKIIQDAYKSLIEEKCGKL